MEIYSVSRIGELLKGNTYPGRGIIVGKSPDGNNVVTAYFIMGRSANSRNRIFTVKDGEVFTEPFDSSKVVDPSLIIYAAVRKYGNNLIVTNGNQTDTIVDGLMIGKSFSESLESRGFEPDSPNWTPRISAIASLDSCDFSYQMSILKSLDAAGSACSRYTFSYSSSSGLGHFIHTYVCDGNPIPTFQGEPERVVIGNDIDSYTDEIWDALDEQNRISLYVRFTNLKTNEYLDRIINKNK